MTRELATATTLVDDDRVCVTRFDFASGAETGWHVRGHDHVVTPVTARVMEINEPGLRTKPIAARSESSTISSMPGQR
ncbi:hypothetical protein [Hoeflea sp. YIM 152468]|uniref:hypothetical protein n=1 Tax=Hoeflea sp. YIM 152468 TaxID=3031759 RepID=UPI0031B8251B